jgi:CYTH domain-containing protein
MGEFAAGPGLEKRRHEVNVAGLIWRVDEYLDGLEGLVTADVELPAEGHQTITPPWVGEEITGDKRFSSATLAAALQETDAAMRIVETFGWRQTSS